MSQREVIQEFPSLKVFAPTVYIDGTKQVQHGVDMYMRGGCYYAYSTMLYAITNNQDPIAAFKMAEKDGEAVYWISPRSSSLTSHKREQRVAYAYAIGDIVRFQGKLFELQAAPNNNVTLEEVVKLTVSQYLATFGGAHVSLQNNGNTYQVDYSGSDREDYDHKDETPVYQINGRIVSVIEMSGIYII
jgi:hypothetical protein